MVAASLVWEAVVAASLVWEAVEVASLVWETVVVSLTLEPVAGLILEPSPTVIPAVLERLFVWVMAESFDAMILGLNFQTIVTS